jgi:hypothetical protein
LTEETGALISSSHRPGDVSTLDCSEDYAASLVAILWVSHCPRCAVARSGRPLATFLNAPKAPPPRFRVSPPSRFSGEVRPGSAAASPPSRPAGVRSSVGAGPVGGCVAGLLPGAVPRLAFSSY